MCYHHVKGPSRFKQRLFCGETVSADDLNYGSPRHGLPSGTSDLVGRMDLGLVVARPIHRCTCLISALSVSGALPGSVQPCTNAGVVLTFANPCGTC